MRLIDSTKKTEFMIFIDSDDDRWEVGISLGKKGDAAMRAREYMILKEHIDMALDKIQALRAAAEEA